MTISGPIYSRGATLGINRVKSYNRFASANSKTITADEAGYSYGRDEGTNLNKVVSVASGTTVLVSGVPGNAIEVDNYTIVASGASTVKFLSGSTDITGTMSIGANGGIATNTDNGSLVKTAVGEALSIVTTSNVAGHLSYRLV